MARPDVGPFAALSGSGQSISMDPMASCRGDLRGQRGRLQIWPTNAGARGRAAGGDAQGDEKSKVDGMAGHSRDSYRGASVIRGTARAVLGSTARAPSREGSAVSI
jgi:hypothetical protein